VSGRVSRPVRLAGWLAAANLGAIAVALGLTPASRTAAAFAAWCGIG
jgi:hypothetical protein